MCSKCWRDSQKAKEKEIASTPKHAEVSSIESKEPPKVTKETESKQLATPVTELVENQPAPKQKDSSRCFSCNKKVGLLGFHCRCELVFCGLHRNAEDHNCTFDYKAQHKAKLESQNPQIKSDKVTRI